MLFKGIVFLLVCGLFISRLIPKYLEFRETSQVDLLGLTWHGHVALLVLLGIAGITIIVLIASIKSFITYFSAAGRSGN